VIYLDTSAIVKVVVAEPESAALVDWLNDHGEATWATSVIGRIEVMRAANRVGQATAAAARRILETIDMLVLTEAIVALAESLVPWELRTLDAIHLATAQIYRPSLEAFCVYDRRLGAAAEAQQLPVAFLGRDTIE
jgi:predicted nucleic acid-binding protein